VVRCSQCREVVASSVEELPSNCWARYLVEVVEKQDQLIASNPTCQSCTKGRPAIAYCTHQDCRRAFLCSSCVDTHKTLLITKSHKIDTLVSIKREEVDVAAIID